MMAQRATTSGSAAERGDSEPIEYLGRSNVDAGRERRLHAALEQHHSPCMARGRPGGRWRPAGAPVRQAPLERAWQERSHRPGESEECVHAPPVRHDLAQQQAPGAGHRAAGYTLFGQRTADVEEPPVLHARRTGALAGAAGETAIQVQLGARRHRLSLQQLFHQIDAPARTVELIPE